jgi:6,7-dimethyl-8-ribityllumazine synthase
MTAPRANPRPPKAPLVAVVVSRYNASVTDKLLDGAREAYARRGGLLEDLTVITAPGAYELPALALAAARTGRFRGVVTLGCLIKGETRHDRYIAEAVAQGLVNVTIATGVPAAFGLLTVDTPEQARARAGGPRGNKGAEAMDALLDTIEQTDALRHAPRPAGGPRARRETAGPAFGRPTPLPDKAARRPRAGRDAGDEDPGSPRSDRGPKRGGKD